MAASDTGLADWLRCHRFLRPVELSEGESGMALLILWEVDHGGPFPRQGGEALSGALLGFTRRLKRRVELDSELQEWLACRYVQQPLAPGLAPSHHTRWSVQICPPPAGDPQGWYADFRVRWRSFLELQARPHGLGRVAAPTALAVPAAAPLVVRPRAAGDDAGAAPKGVPLAQPSRAARRRSPPLTARAPAAKRVCVAAVPSLGAPPADSRPVAPLRPPRRRQAAVRPREEEGPPDAPAPKRTGDIRAFFSPPLLVPPAAADPQPAPACRHGRAAAGPPS